MGWNKYNEAVITGNKRAGKEAWAGKEWSFLHWKVDELAADFVEMDLPEEVQAKVLQLFEELGHVVGRMEHMYFQEKIERQIQKVLKAKGAA